MGAPLDEYEQKRNLPDSPEPPARTSHSATGRRYMIHKHAATRLHYDLRLEHDGVMLSWAVPKGPSLDTKQRRLAVHVEDHPVDYADFEGVIPEGEYGAGTVMVWDDGEWSPHGDVDESLASGKLVFDLEGRKLAGRFALIHTGARKTGREKDQWLLIKEKDGYVRPSAEYDVTAEAPESAASGRTMEQISEDGETASGDDDEPPSWPEGAIASDMPRSFEPMLASRVASPPVGAGWIHELKHDGYRILALIDNGNAMLLSRSGEDYTERFASLAAAFARLHVDSAAIDCEAVVLAADGTSSFAALQQALSERSTGDAVAFCFDLVYLDGYDLSHASFESRRAALERVLAGVENRSLRVSEGLDVEGAALLDAACRLGAEGIVSKRKDSPYFAGRSRHWLKTRCVQRQEFVVGGFTAPKRGTTGFGALVVGYYESGSLAYAGRVGSGFSERMRDEIASRLSPIVLDSSPFAEEISPVEGRAVTWVKPLLVAEVAFTEWTSSGKLRHPRFVGLRDDKDPADVVRESSLREVPGIVGDPTVLGVKITHPERRMVANGPTKLELAKFYSGAAQAVLAHLEGRRLTLLRCPSESQAECFWQRHIEAGLLPHVETEADGESEWIHLFTAEGLVELVQYLAVEFHAGGSGVELPDRPDRIVFDLDPGPDVDWDTLRAGALLVRTVLENIGLVPFLKTTGGHGLHVVAPIEPRVPTADVALATKSIAQSAVELSGGRMTLDPKKSARPGRIFLDWHRNSVGQSAVAAYTVRARPRALVATPITWDELADAKAPLAFATSDVLERLDRDGDPWAAMDASRGRLAQEPLPGM